MVRYLVLNMVLLAQQHVLKGVIIILAKEMNKLYRPVV